MKELSEEEKRALVRSNYGQVAKAGAGCGCNPESSCCGPEPVSSEQASKDAGYSQEEIESIPEGSNMGLGCGNPHAIAGLKTGETVLDLGCGGGFDCFLAARQVGDTGKIIGVDMTPEMIDKARANAKKSDYGNVEFRLGEIENLPVADDSIDVILSNCVINLSPDKARVLAEAYRVLRKGGRLSFSDILATEPLSPELQNNEEAICSCIGGAATIEEMETLLEEAGFKDVVITPDPGSREMISRWMPGIDLKNTVLSVSIEGFRP